MSSDVTSVNIDASTLAELLSALLVEETDGLLFGEARTTTVVSHNDEEEDGSLETRMGSVSGFALCHGPLSDVQRVAALSGGEPLMGYLALRRGTSLCPSIRELAVADELRRAHPNTKLLFGLFNLDLQNNGAPSTSSFVFSQMRSPHVALRVVVRNVGAARSVAALPQSAPDVFVPDAMERWSALAQQAQEGASSVREGVLDAIRSASALCDAVEKAEDQLASHMTPAQPE